MTLESKPPPGQPGGGVLKHQRAAEYFREPDNRTDPDLSQGFSAAFMAGALDEISRQQRKPPPARRPRRRNSSAPDMAEIPDLALLDRIDYAVFHGKPLRIDGLDLLRLYDGDLTFWLADAPLIVVPDVLADGYIRTAFTAAKQPCPPIFVEARHG